MKKPCTTGDINPYPLKEKTSIPTGGIGQRLCIYNKIGKR